MDFILLLDLYRNNIFLNFDGSVWLKENLDISCKHFSPIKGCIFFLFTALYISLTLSHTYALALHNYTEI